LSFFKRHRYLSKRLDGRVTSMSGRLQRSPKLAFDALWCRGIYLLPQLDQCRDLVHTFLGQFQVEICPRRRVVGKRQTDLFNCQFEPVQLLSG
jgi:hypothetical protein